MTQKERMLLGLPYLSEEDELLKESETAFKKTCEFNKINKRSGKEQEEILRSLFKKCGENIRVIPPFHCDYGKRVEIGDNFFANYNCVMLDCAGIKIGDNCMFGPNVSLFTAGHPIHPEIRNTQYEYAIPIEIGNNVWIGGMSVINPGVKIGDNAVIGSGSVVTHNVERDTIVCGNPAKLLRRITDEDKKYYFKDRLFKID